MSEIEENKTEQDYLELSEVFKDTIAKKSKDFNKLKLHYIETYKLLMMSYTIIRLSDSILSNIDLQEEPMIRIIKIFLEMQRGEISSYIDEMNEIDTSDEDEY
tara:strand:- start:150 stop:458 length:309 start_codon:yes stop_codon:yes gene_type:complete